jgi:hypothetical protein
MYFFGAVCNQCHGIATSPYTARAVHFNGTSSLAIDALSCQDSPVSSTSFWFRNAFFDAAPGGGAGGVSVGGLSMSSKIIIRPPPPDVFQIFGTGIYSQLGIVISDFFYATAVTGQPGKRFSLETNNNVNDGLWHHIMSSVSTNFPANSKLGKIYVDDVDVTNILQDNDDEIPVIDINGGNFSLGFDGIGYGTSEVMDIADFWFAPGVSLLTDGDITEASRRMFINADGKPVNPSQFPEAAVLFSGDQTTFLVNQGTGGDFAVTGAVTNADSSPSS